MAKGKVGLQKEISSIFTGVQIPKQNPAEGVLTSTPTGPSQFVPPKPIPSSTRAPVTVREHRVFAPPPQQAEHIEQEKPAPVRQVRPEPVHKVRRQIPLLQIWQKIQGKLFAPKHGVTSGRQKAMVVMAPLLFVVFTVVLMQVLKKPAATPPKPTNAFTQSGATAASAGKINWQIPSPYPVNFRDPMQLGSVKREPNDGASELVVKGIVFSDDRPAAVIGNDIVFEGDTVGGAKVVKINQDSVEFQTNDKKWMQKVVR